MFGMLGNSGSAVETKDALSTIIECLVCLSDPAKTQEAATKLLGQVEQIEKLLAEVSAKERSAQDKLTAAQQTLDRANTDVEKLRKETETKSADLDAAQAQFEASIKNRVAALDVKDVALTAAKKNVDAATSKIAVDRKELEDQRAADQADRVLKNAAYEKTRAALADLVATRTSEIEKLRADAAADAEAAAAARQKWEDKLKALSAIATAAAAT